MSFLAYLNLLTSLVFVLFILSKQDKKTSRDYNIATVVFLVMLATGCALAFRQLGVL